MGYASGTFFVWSLAFSLAVVAVSIVAATTSLFPPSAHPAAFCPTTTTTTTTTTTIGTTNTTNSTTTITNSTTTTTTLTTNAPPPHTGGWIHVSAKLEQYLLPYAATGILTCMIVYYTTTGTLVNHGETIHQFVLNAHAAHGLRMEVLTVLFTVSAHNIAAGGLYVVIASTSILVAIISHCALFGSPEMTAGLALMTGVQTAMTVIDAAFVKKLGAEFYVVPLVAAGYAITSFAIGRPPQFRFLLPTPVGAVGEDKAEQ